MWKRTGFEEEAVQLINSDFRDLSLAANRLAHHAIKLGGIGFGASFFGLFAAIAAIYLLILDRTNWKTNILTALLIPYIFFSLPSLIFDVFRGELGKWIAAVAVVLRLFLPRHFPAPSLIASTFRDNIVGVVVCLIIACYLLQEHIRASGGFRNSFTKAHGISNSIGIILLLVYPIWALVVILF
ncbi:hypothetical protein GLYMA_12G047500v4 [Glycine max]|uniref:Cold-regulated protein n=1 Tax=Glycine max TaxID=3847 RepID=I1LQ84_SOYBN|nr:hypothetical protein GYH30_032719 [Glycine max]KRH24537.1 hypothetical protein GLYMA_12G047500v4 [Glycine max]